MNIESTIEKDLDWREKEIASIRILLKSDNLSPLQKQALLRAAWAILYAHFEGFCKNSLTAFFEGISKSDILCHELPYPTQIFALKNRLTQLKNLPNAELLDAILKFQSDEMEKIPIFPDVDTESNLWPSVLINLLEIANLDAERVRINEAKIKTLVSRRNKIAHGENNIINEVDYYFTYEEVVYTIIYDIALQVIERLSKTPYSG